MKIRILTYFPPVYTMCNGNYAKGGGGMDKKSAMLPVAAAAMGNVFWGFSFLFTRTALQIAPPEIMLSVRFTLSLLI